MIPGCVIPGESSKIRPGQIEPVPIPASAAISTITSVITGRIIVGEGRRVRPVQVYPVSVQACNSTIPVRGIPGQGVVVRIIERDALPRIVIRKIPGQGVVIR